MSIGGHHSPTSNTTTWLTPPAILAALGPFDLDPCAAPEPRPWPTATEHYALAERNGLTSPWYGRIWLNPPYGSPAVVNPWLARLAEHGSGTALIFARTETDMWFRYIWPHATAIMFLRGRLHFHSPDGLRAENNAGAPSALIAYGTLDAERLCRSGLDGFVFTTKQTVPKNERGSPHLCDTWFPT